MVVILLVFSKPTAVAVSFFSGVRFSKNDSAVNISLIVSGAK